MKHANKLIRFLLYSFFLLSGKSAAAQTFEAPIITALDGSYYNPNNQTVVNQIKKDSSTTTEDDKWWIPDEKAKLDLSGKYRIKNIISLKLNLDATTILKPAFSVSLKVRLFITKDDGSLDSSLTPFLSITYDTAAGAVYNSQSVFTFYDAYRVKVKILSVDSVYTPSNVNPKPPVTAFVRLENEMQIEREYNFTCDAGVGRGVKIKDSEFSTTGEIEVSWSQIAGATEYDLEWAFVDNEALSDPDLYKTDGNLDAKKIFTDNATRITIQGTSYDMPVLYDEQGTVYIRYRPVQNKPSGLRYEGKWNTDGGSDIDYFTTENGHEPSLNWQATTSFAEEGKRKSVVQYYDGSLRSRQTVTKDNTTNTTVVAETFYDFQGRPVIQVLPAPTLNTLISYTPNFNQGINSVAYEKNLYDTLLNKSDYCLSPAPPMESSTSGAANYYSENNPQVSENYHQYIPKANGYAFTETRYTQDNTGRVLAQSGVGETYKIGSGRETKYYYGNPSQAELDGLFGTEVGYASHYQKTMVRDANGQYSVSYIDMHGRTVATALAGKAPAVMDTLPSYKKINVTEKLADSTNNITYGLVLESSRSIFVTDSAAYTFNYGLSPDSLKVQTCTGSNICYDCLYNLEITITDECNNCHLPNQQPYVVTRSNFTFASIDTICNTINGLDTTFSINLAEGNYTITKKLSISKDGLDYYRDSVFMKKNTCKTFADFYKQQMDSIKAGMDCSPESCDSCTARTATIASFRNYYLNNNGISPADSVQYRDDIAQAYEDTKELCNFICSNAGEYSLMRKLLLMDMTAPFGQYANPDSANLANSYGNIFNYQQVPVWRKPAYHNEYGYPDSIMNNSGIAVPPSDASISQEEFIANFKTIWAKDLLKYHPEYQKLLAYENYKDSHVWDEKFGNSDTYADANSKGYLNPAGNSGAQLPSHFNTYSTGLDPLALSGQLLATEMPNIVYNFKTNGTYTFSMWGTASVSGKCPDNNNCAAAYTNSSINNCINPSGFCTGELDMSWRSFRQMYLSHKRRFLMHKLDSLYPYVHVSIPLYRLEHFAESDAAAEAYAQSIQGQSSGTILAGANSQMQQFYRDNCENYAASWWTSLAPCNLTAADSTRLIPRMVQICIAGSDGSHPFGSSSTAPGSNLQYKSFEALIKHYIDSMHQVNPSQYNYNISCNADVIYAPMPYDKQQPLSIIPIWTNPDSCQCSRITGLYNDYKQYGTSDTSFAAYILRQTGTSISDADLIKLRNLCTGADTCKFLTAAINLPPALQCGIIDVCVTCTQVRNAFDSFKVVYPGILPAYDESDSVQSLKNRAFANYMNNHLGFSKQAVDYLSFMDNCPVGYITDSVYCDSLKKILADYQRNNFNTYTAHYDTGGCDTTVWKINKTGWNHNAGFSFGDYMENSVLRIPESDTANVAQDSLSIRFVYADTLCLNNNFSFESRVRVPVKQNHLQHYISQGNNGDKYGSYYQQFRFNNNLEVKVWLARGKAYHPSGTDSIYAYVEAFENGLQTVNHRNISTGLKNLAQWHTVKTELKNGTLKIYLNGQLLDQSSYSTSFSQFYQSAFNALGYDLQTDWVKMYDSAGTLKYFEDFIGCAGLGRQTLPRCSSSNCQTGFAAYYNSIKGTSFSFAQLDTVYYNHCGIHPDPCTGDIKNCEQLKAIVKDFYTSQFGISYDSTGYESGVWTTGGSYVVRPAGFWANMPIKKMMGDGMVKGLPDTVTVSVGDYAVGYSLPMCTGNEFSIETRLRIKPGYDATQAQVFVYNNFDTWDKWLITQFTGNSTYNGFQGIRNGSYFGDWDHEPMHILFSDWKKLKISFKENKIWVYIDDTLRGTTYFPGTIYKLNSFSLGGWNDIPVQIDWLKMYDAAGNLKFKEEFNDYTNFTKPPYEWICPPVSCSSNFPALFNSRFGTNYSFNQISQLYQRNCGIYFGACGLNETMLCGKTEPLFPPVNFEDISPCADSSSLAFVKATELYNAYKDSLKSAFENAYLQKCMQAFKTESFTVTHPLSEYHYTLYYYDQPGNLVKTVPPAGVDLSNYSNNTWLASVATARKNGTTVVPAHGLQTNYRYNTLNQVVAQSTPDAGESHFWYDRLGRLVLSQNAKQQEISEPEQGRKYSYTKYDVLGRIAEVGQLTNNTNTAITQAVAQDVTAYASWFTNATASNTYIEMVTRTFYDNPYPALIGLPELYAKNLRNRVAYSTYTDGNSAASYNNATFYSYDIHGNVDTLVQDYGQSITGVANVMNSNGSRWKRIVYRYDLISGKVNHVAYQPNYYYNDKESWYYVVSQDAMYHRYSYDAENRLTLVETSTDSTIWQRDARYQYYKHGPLARMVLGQQQVQGVDYAYTLQGWLKGVNSTTLTSGFDMGLDGNTGNANTKNIARDAYSFNLNYFNGDYAAISGANVFAGIGTLPSPDLRNLYNGNITSMAVNIGKFNSAATPAGDSALLYNYKYDQLNRIVAMDAFRGLNTNENTWNNSLTKLSDYQERVSYDANGNITKYKRNGRGSTLTMDNLTYNYSYSGGMLQNNRLNYVRDTITGSGSYNSNYADDIDDQASGNYSYDAIGNLVADNAEGITQSSGGIKWNVYGKIQEVNKVDSSSTVMNRGRIEKITYSYDAAGNRISKKVKKYGSDNINYTWYVRDASGNVMSTYSYISNGTTDLNANKLRQDEVYLYGSSRLGSLTVNRDVEVTKQDGDTTYNMPNGISVGLKLPFVSGLKQYELTNHLGNVLVTISDKKLQHNNGSGQVDYFTADVITAQDYYPFGMNMPGRKYSAGSGYRYGFNGKENDKDISEGGQDYGMRISDNRLGRFLSVDPITAKYPELTPYQFASNRPIDGVDLDGLEWYSDKNALVWIGGIKYDSKTKTITEAKTYFIPGNISLTLHVMIHQLNMQDCPSGNCFGYQGRAEHPDDEKEIMKETREVTNLSYFSQDEPTMSDVQEYPSATKPQNFQTPVVPKSKAEARKQEKTGKFFTDGAVGRNAKATKVLVVIEAIGKILEWYLQTDAITTARNAVGQSKMGASYVLDIIQNDLTKGAKSIIPEKFRNGDCLDALANYLLYGKKPDLATTSNGISYDNNELLKIGDKLLPFVNAKKTAASAPVEVKPTTKDNTNVNKNN